MRKLMAVTAVTVVLAFTAGGAFASSCPKVIKEGREAAAKMKADDPKAKAAVAKLDEAQKLHDGGKHAESLKLASEATADRKSGGHTVVGVARPQNARATPEPSRRGVTMRFPLACATVLALTLVSSGASASSCAVLLHEGRASRARMD